MPAIPRHILVLRFSALGDIAMAVPVIKNLLQQYPSLKVTFVSVPFVKPLFDGIERLDFYGVDIKNDYKGFKGLYNLSKKLKHEIDLDAVADIHDVLRTKILRFFLGKQNAVIDKGRKEKKELTRPLNKILRPLKTGFQRYADVFGKLGYKITLLTEKVYSSLQPDTSLLPGKKENNFYVGLAPFAKHNAKLYPLDKMEKAVDLLLQDERINLFVFAAKNELPAINNWLQKSNNISLVAGKYSLAQELNFISQLDAMISMDSANMHLASLFGVPVISIWGGTHPFLGFYGWGQRYENIIQTDMPCRPSSVFGNKDCPVHGPAGCMQQIKPEMIYDKTIAVLKSRNL
jgi:ADP-heptose:LPS heptosyltransferase